MRTVYSLCLCLLFLLFSACEGTQSEPLGNYRQDIVTLRQGEAPHAVQLVWDTGRRFDVIDAPQWSAKDDGTRILAYYIIAPDGDSTHVSLGNYYRILTLSPRIRLDGVSSIQDPLQVPSIWMSAPYINMQVQWMGTNAHIHYFLLDRLGTRPNKAGGYTHHLRLVHQAEGDKPYYPLSTYLSLNVSSLFQDQYSLHDSVTVAVRTSLVDTTYYHFSLDTTALPLLSDSAPLSITPS